MWVMRRVALPSMVYVRVSFVLSSPTKKKKNVKYVTGLPHSSVLNGFLIL